MNSYLEQRFEEMLALQDGWCGPGSKAVVPESVQIAREFFENSDTTGHNIAVGPSGDGDVVLEWDHQGRCYTVEICNGHIWTYWFEVANADYPMYDEGIDHEETFYLPSDLNRWYDDLPREGTE